MSAFAELENCLYIYQKVAADFSVQTIKAILIVQMIVSMRPQTEAANDPRLS